eukprot:CAMPEP_0202031776 /NCGR_PEP_ID=MMETSP0905-20130828/65190_1 /ASSEMBLY_ACC=CAM_ASM_000554 /TAXON_ID=420261 /ORGANISM="Thalassiosira antarctica, Strain CCMP982" /LENGTH=694 /DNA_ID=CAMNT_0048595623 /DNA_START=59 /DNA_END=2144 /DNA_ORIENTATION=+
MNDDAALFLALSGQQQFADRVMSGAPSGDGRRPAAMPNDETNDEQANDAALFLAYSGHQRQQHFSDRVVSGALGYDDRKPAAMPGVEEHGEQAKGPDDVTKVRVRVNGMLQNDFCQAVLPVPGQFSSDMAESVDDQGAAAMTDVEKYDDKDAKPSALEMDGVIGLQRIGQPIPPFLISDTRRKNATGSPLCLAVDCEKNAQANTKINHSRGFCRVHFNLWLISTGQIESWDCVCGNKVPVEKRCGKCHRWKEKGQTYSKPTSDLAKTDNGSQNPTTLVPPNSGIQIAAIRETNEKNRPLCKVVGCNKLDQSKNDGFCRKHFNMFSIDGTIVDWTCVCGQTIPGKQKRCGECNKWRGGKQAPYATTPKNPKKPRLSTTNIKSDVKSDDVAIARHWTCDCGIVVPSTKSRCGKCHHWRGGKRKAGWKIKPAGNNPGDDGVAWAQDWSCCAEVIPASKKRCGKCHRWRGGKRVAAKSSQGTTASQEDRRPTWECKNCNTSNLGTKRKCGGCLEWKNSIKFINVSTEEKASANGGPGGNVEHPIAGGGNGDNLELPVWAGATVATSGGNVEHPIAGGVHDGNVELPSMGRGYGGNVEHTSAGGVYDGNVELPSMGRGYGGNVEHTSAGGVYDGNVELPIMGRSYGGNVEHISAGGVYGGNAEHPSEVRSYGGNVVHPSAGGGFGVNFEHPSEKMWRMP